MVVILLLLIILVRLYQLYFNKTNNKDLIAHCSHSAYGQPNLSTSIDNYDIFSLNFYVGKVFIPTMDKVMIVIWLGKTVIVCL